MRRLQLALLLLIVLQNSSYTLLRRYSRGVLHESYTSSSVLGVAETIKFVTSFLMLDTGSGATSTLKNRFKVAQNALLGSRPMLVPAVVYLVMNMLSFVAIDRIDATVFAMGAQLKMLTTAVSSRYVLGRIFTKSQWLAICCLTLSVMIVTCQRGLGQNSGGQTSQKIPHSSDWTSFCIGCGALALEVVLSGWISAYLEKYLKDGAFSVWARNFQVAAFSMVMYCSVDIYLTYFQAEQNDGSTMPVIQPIGLASSRILKGWSIYTCMLAFLGASGGLLVAFATKHADAVAKTIATAMALVLVVVLETVLLNVPFDPVVCMASSLTLLTMESYREAGKVSQKVPQLTVEREFDVVRE